MLGVVTVGAGSGADFRRRAIRASRYCIDDSSRSSSIVAETSGGGAAGVPSAPFKAGSGRFLSGEMCVFSERGQVALEGTSSFGVASFFGTATGAANGFGAGRRDGGGEGLCFACCGVVTGNTLGGADQGSGRRGSIGGLGG